MYVQIHDRVFRDDCLQWADRDEGISPKLGIRVMSPDGET